MTTTRDQLVRDAATRGKYAPLYRQLLSAHPEPEWRTTFDEIEAILGFRLPDSARLHRPWWSNSKKGNGHSHSLAWQAAGWRTREVDLKAETLVFVRREDAPGPAGAPAVRDAATRGKYAPLYHQLLSAHPEPEWRTTFDEIEAILGFRLPDSARLHRPWWSNSKKGNGHSHSLAWQAAGWRTREVDLKAETLVFVRREDAPGPAGAPARRRRFSIREILPPHDPGPWPEGFTVSREQIYDDMGRLTGGPENAPGDDR